MEIYSNSVADRLLACLIQKPSLLLEDKYHLNKDEFKPILFHQIIYITIYNLANKGYVKITTLDINEFLKPFEAQYKVYIDNNGDKYISTMCEIVDENNFESYYNEFKKYSVLNRYKDIANISAFWDFTKDDNSNKERISELTVQDIVNYFENQQLQVSREYITADSELKEIKAGYGFYEFKESLKESPLYGFGFLSNLLNTVTRGMVKGQLTCFSSATGVGKTTIATATMCNMCATHIWDDKEKAFIENKNKTCNGALYIEYELDLIKEVTPKLISYISGVPSNKILDGKYTEEEELRIDTANQIISDSNIWLVYMPNFTRKSIDDCVKNYVLNYNIEALYFDYLADCPSLNAEMTKANGGVGMRPDMILASLSDFLKQESKKYDIAVYTCTQTNANLGSTEILGEESIAGSRAVANKLDVGGIFMPLRPKEKKALELIIPKGFIHKPTHIFHMYKTRFSHFPKNIKVWVNVDMGTGKVQDCFCTTWDNKLIEVPLTELQK